MYQVRLTREERLLVRKLARIELKSLASILLEDTEEDLVMWRADNEINKQEFEDELMDRMDLFDEILERPSRFINLPEVEMSIFRHLLFNNKSLRFKAARKKIWTKMIIMDSNQWYNLN